jgi:chorismate mutase
MSTVVRAIRGATTLDQNEATHLTERVQEMVRSMYASNEIDAESVISLLFTSTPDVTCKFPALAARELGLDDVPLLDAVHLPVEGMLPMCVRAMMYVNTDKQRSEFNHVFQHGARGLRPDLDK